MSGQESAQVALDRWSSFPVDEVPRPIVLAGPCIWSERDFEVEAQRTAFAHGVLRCIKPLPDEILQIAQVIRKQAIPYGNEWIEPLDICSLTKGEADFLTDRGPRKLPAYRLGGHNFSGGIWVLHPGVLSQAWGVDDEHWHEQTSAPASISAQVLHSAGLRLRVSYLENSNLGAVPVDEIVESRQAVVLLLNVLNESATASDDMRGHRRELDVRLSEPLGNRVVVDQNGTPVVVSNPWAASGTSQNDLTDKTDAEDKAYDEPELASLETFASGHELHDVVQRLIRHELARYEEDVAEVYTNGARDDWFTNVKPSARNEALCAPFTVAVHGHEVHGAFASVRVVLGSGSESLELLRLLVEAVLAGRYEQVGLSRHPLGRFYTTQGPLVAGALYLRIDLDRDAFRLRPYGDRRP